jgi:hypothetical protein
LFNLNLFNISGTQETLPKGVAAMSHPGAAAAPPVSAEPVTRPQVPRGVILAIACMANFMVIIDTSIVNVALPAMKAALGLSAADQQWVVNAYLITFGGFLLLAARAGDLFGRKGVFQAGLMVFTAASLAGGLAQDPWLLIAARVLQGIGAAALASSSLSLITASHPRRSGPDSRTVLVGRGGLFGRSRGRRAGRAAHHRAVLALRAVHQCPHRHRVAHRRRGQPHAVTAGA